MASKPEGNWSFLEIAIKSLFEKSIKLRTSPGGEQKKKLNCFVIFYAEKKKSREIS